jgi:hypothetical protein
MQQPMTFVNQLPLKNLANPLTMRAKVFETKSEKYQKTERSTANLPENTVHPHGTGGRQRSGLNTQH